ncbi:MAG: hypothetical protein QF822_05680 [Candidatus Poseidoniia archaeon]|jgi:hypothetical protein|nr:hypothetical protein [Candidatus Poseidoniia archaeon]MDP6534691.1 hypothetical protein [Candidatus Poseidoniia archaeon]MDP6834634.1 hypothetical protein [Candidatus Poseidoniia archaeon]HIH78747.1 hypothetical protein [Candidatus Poseidoniia archaeon]
MEESICQIEIVSNGNDFVARVASGMGGSREILSSRFSELLNQLISELHAEFEPDLQEVELEPDF